MKFFDIEDLKTTMAGAVGISTMTFHGFVVECTAVGLCLYVWCRAIRAWKNRKGKE